MTAHGPHVVIQNDDQQSAQALGAAVREQQRREPAAEHDGPSDGAEPVSADAILDEAFTALLALGVTVVAACALTGRARATYYRRLSHQGRRGRQLAAGDVEGHAA